MSTRWIMQENKFGERPDIDAFLAEVISVCQKHRLAIAHEDGHGAFVIHALEPGIEDWLLSAYDGRENGVQP